MTNVQAKEAKHGWRDWLRPQVLTLLLLGFSAGLPILLIFSSLSIWLLEAGVERKAVTLFSWAALGYSFKFFWAPVVDKLPLPWLTRRLGRRRGWLLTTQLFIIAAICWMAFTDPSQTVLPMALAAILLGFSSATQDIVIDALRIESAEARLQALLSSSYIAGYRIGMLAAGAGALKLAAAFAPGEAYHYPAWQLAYLCMAAAMLVGVATTLFIREPEATRSPNPWSASLADYLGFVVMFVGAAAAFITAFLVLKSLPELTESTLSGLLGDKLSGFLGEATRLLLSISAAMLAGHLLTRTPWVNADLFRETYVEPALDFTRRYGHFAILILLLIGFYRVSDIVLGVISNVFYTEKGYDKDQIANIAKTFGLLMTLLGGFLGGGLAMRLGVMPVLLLGAILSSATNLLFLLLAHSDPGVELLVLVIAADNLAGGLASAAFVAYLSALTNIAFTAFQYAVFSSLMTLFPKLLGGYSGAIVDGMGYGNFFILTTLIGLPVILLTWLAMRHHSELRVPE